MTHKNMTKYNALLYGCNYKINKEIEDVDMSIINKLMENKDEIGICKYLLFKNKENELKYEDEKKDILLKNIVRLLKKIPDCELNRNGIYKNYENISFDDIKEDFFNICNKRNCSKYKPIVYNNCNVPAHGFKKGWSGPSFWSFSKGLPYKYNF